jgi:signal transduction histidine kinase
MKKTQPNSYNDFRWVILLLAGAVILPTVCLLWFMMQAVRNVQFAAQQLLIDEYSNRVNEQIKSVDKIWDERTKVFQGIPDVNAIEYFYLLVFDKPIADGVIVYDQSGKSEYPIIQTVFAEPNLPEEFKHAWELEFVKKDYENAAHTYFDVWRSANDDYSKRKAHLGAVRCYWKANKIEFASSIHHLVTHYRFISDLPPEIISLAVQEAIMYAQINKEQAIYEVALNDLLHITNSYISSSVASEYKLFQEHSKPFPSYIIPMDSGTRIFAQEKAIQFVEEFQGEFKLITRSAIEPIKILHASEVISAQVIQLYSNDTSIRQWLDWNLHRLDTRENFFGTYIQSGKKNILLIWSGSTIKNDFAKFEKLFAHSDIVYRIIDNKGLYLSGIEKPDSNPFLKIPLGEYFRDWHVELFLVNSNVFENAANKQVAIYIWAGVLVIALILLTSSIAGRSISRQMKMNRLKNDFIATVTHELKTPLASMRVLADTLLEGNFTDQKQEKEYLELICRENKRLTGLIDNFLTFSRMERNKQVFNFEKVSPAEIAKAAIEAVQAKFSQKNCIFSVTIEEGLPSIRVDKDAIITVLVNLLDNACKYTYDNKQIEFKTFSEGKNVCFSVKDNGIGMTRRQMRKIFDKFYQADTALSRRNEGTGLGLSIVKFILDAHKAKINVQSQIEKGSTFTVKIPIFQGNLQR